jgi:hypothetical protein
MRMTEQPPPLSIRITDDSRRALQAFADKNIRSLGAEIRFRLEESLESQYAHEGALEQIRAHLKLLIARTEPAPDGDFDEVWEKLIAVHPQGTGYKYWARFGWDAAKRSKFVTALNDPKNAHLFTVESALEAFKDVPTKD